MQSLRLLRNTGSLSWSQLVMVNLKSELGEQLVSSGVAADNALGLTTQMPVQQTFLSRTRSPKRYRFGKQGISLHQAPRWQFLLTDRPADQAIRALAWLVEVLNEQDAQVLRG